MVKSLKVLTIKALGGANKLAHNHGIMLTPNNLRKRRRHT